METALNRTELNRLQDLAQTDGLNATARRIGIGKATLHRILHGGATPSADTAGKILACLRGDMVTDGPVPEEKVRTAEPEPEAEQTAPEPEVRHYVLEGTLHITVTVTGAR